MSTPDAINWSALGVIIAGAAVMITLFTLVWNRGARLAKIESDLEYMRRDLNQLLALYKLVPAEEQDRRRKGQR